MTDEDVAAEDAWFREHWEKTGHAIRFALSRARAAGPAGLADRKCHPGDARSTDWCDPVETTASAGVLRQRRSLAFTTLQFEVRTGPAEGRLERIMTWAETVGAAEQQRFVEALVPDTFHSWKQGAPLPLSDLLDPELSYDAVLNMDSPCGQAVAPHEAWLAERLGGRVVSGAYGSSVPALFIPVDVLTVHTAGVEDYTRPSPGLFRIESVGAIECAAGAEVLALAPRPDLAS